MISSSSKALDQPFQVDGTGRIADTSDLTRQIALRVRSIIGTSPGERVMRPGYGAGAANFVFDVNDALRAGILTVNVQDALNAWEPAITVESVKIRDADAVEGRIELLITYRLVSTGELATAVVGVTTTATYGWPT